MKSVQRWSVGICLLVPALVSSGQTQPKIQNGAPLSGAKQETPKPVAVVQAEALVIQTEAIVAQAEQELALANERYKAGLVTHDSVLEASIKLAKARIRLAELKKQPEVILQQAKTIVADQEQRAALMEQLYKAGGKHDHSHRSKRRAHQTL